MKLYLASFLEPENFGPGRVIGVANGSKPDHVFCKDVFPPLIPTNEIMKRYNDTCVSDPKNAADMFINSFRNQLEKFTESVERKAKEEDKTIHEVLPFKNGDTLASWERHAFSNYRNLIAEYLEKLGYEVELH